MAFLPAEKFEDLWDGEMRGIALAERRILLVNVGGKVSAFLDRCAHLGVPMSEGKLEGGALICSAHQWSYDACTGQGINPCSARLHALPVKVEEGIIWVDPEGGIGSG
jgi:toluene monooxygenase system ferredoxin subunit